MKVSTFRLAEELGKAEDLQTFRREYREEFLEETPQSYLERMMREKELTTGQLCERSGLGNYGYKVVSGTRHPSREAAVRIALGLGLNEEQTQHYLRIAQLARLDPRCYRDAALLYAIGHGLDVDRTQVLLTEIGEKDL